MKIQMWSVDDVADQIEKRFPEQEYQVIEVGWGQFNFVWRGRREPLAGQVPA